MMIAKTYVVFIRNIIFNRKVLNVASVRYIFVFKNILKEILIEFKKASKKYNKIAE